MFRRFAAALVFFFPAASPLLAQNAPLSVCLVQIKPDAVPEYDPPAGAWAIKLDEQLSTQKLRSGEPLKITVLAASSEKDLPGEVHRLQCHWVVELRYHGTFSREGRYIGDDEDTVLFYLWNGATRQVIAHGGSLISPIPTGSRRFSSSSLAVPCAALSQQIIRSLNKLP